MKNRKIIALFLAVITVFSIFVGCGKKQNFKPDDLVTRIEYAQLLFEKFYGKEEIKEKKKTLSQETELQMPYADVDVDSKHYVYAALLFENCMIQDDELENGLLKPDEYITREVAVAWAVRMIGLSVEETYDISGIKDNSYITDIYTAISNEIINVGNEFYPNENPKYSEVADILDKAYRIYEDIYAVEEERYNVTFLESVKQIEQSENKNIVIENDDYHCVLSNISDDLKNLNAGDIVAIQVDNDIRNRLLFKVAVAEYTGDSVNISKDPNIELDEIVSDLDFCFSYVVTPEDIDESTLPEGITLLDSDTSYTASKKYIGKGDASELAGGLNFKIDRQLNDITKITGTVGLSLTFSKVEYDKKTDELIFKCTQKYYTDLKLDAASSNVDKELHGENKFPLMLPLKIPAGLGDLNVELKSDIYFDFGAELTLKSFAAYEKGFTYKNGKIGKLNKCIEKDLDITVFDTNVEKNANIYAETGVVLDAKVCFIYDVVKAGGELSSGVKLSMNLLDGITHPCYVCLDGDFDIVGKLKPKLSIGIADQFRKNALGKLKPITLKIPLFDFYISRETADVTGKFGWGECPNKQKGDKLNNADDNLRDEQFYIDSAKEGLQKIFYSRGDDRLSILNGNIGHENEDFYIVYFDIKDDDGGEIDIMWMAGVQIYKRDCSVQLRYEGNGIDDEYEQFLVENGFRDLLAELKEDTWGVGNKNRTHTYKIEFFEDGTCSIVPINSDNDFDKVIGTYKLIGTQEMQINGTNIIDGDFEYEYSSRVWVRADQKFEISYRYEM